MSKNYKLLFLLIAILFTSLRGFCQDSLDNSWKHHPKKNAFKLHPQQFFAYNFMVGLERVLLKNNSIQVNVGVTAYNSNSNSIYEDRSILGGSAELMYRAYLLPRIKSLQGLYAAPFIKFQHVQIKEGEVTYISYPGTPVYTPAKDYYINSTMGGFIIGYQFLFGNVLTLDLYGGGGMKVSDSNQPNNTYGNDFTFYQNYTGVTPKIGGTIGVAF